MAEPMVKVGSIIRCAPHNDAACGRASEALENGRILELLLNRWALEGSEANLTQLVVPVM